MDAAEIFKVLGVDSRVKIIGLLKSKGPLGSKDIASVVGITPAAVSQHLKILKQVGLVRSERKGYWIPYTINKEAMEACQERLNEVCSCGCKGSLDFREKELDKASISELKRYEKELRDELQTVIERLEQKQNIMR